MLPGFKLLKELEFQEGQKFASFDSAREFLRQLGDPQDSFKSIHIAGTNGKGSVSAFLNGILMSAGYKVGVTTSPHLGSVTERCLINGVPVSEEKYSDSVMRVSDVAREMNIPLTYFVLTLAAALEIFRSEEIEWGVVECGLGGTLDATNSIARPEATVITSIGFDHTEILGNSLEAIAANKAGIAKPGVPMFVGFEQKAAELMIRASAAEVGAPCFVFGSELSLDPTDGFLRTPWGEFNFEDIKIPLSGEHQRYNAALAVAVAMNLEVSESYIRAGLERTRWPGRLEAVDNVLLDVAHNPDGIGSLLNYLDNIYDRFNYVSFLISILGRKDWRGMLDILKRADIERGKLGLPHFAFTRSVHPASLDPDLLIKEFGAGESFASAEEGLRALMQRGGLVVVTGSSFLVGECRMRLLPSEPFSIYKL